MFKFDKRILYVVVGIYVLINVINRLNNTDSMIALIMSLPAILVAITFHEYAHAFAADKLGDDTPRLQGRLTLNPLKHIDIVGFAFLIVAGFGWGKPVEVQPRNFKRNISMTKAQAIVSFAGPLMNFFIAIIATVIFALLAKFNVFAQISNITTITIISTFLTSLISINIGLGVFNLIPLPPLDGSKILKHFLPYNAKVWYERNEYILYIVLLILWITNLVDLVIGPCIYGVEVGIIKLVGLIFGMDLL